MKIGIFGGSFDPVHREHVHFVRAAIDCLRLDKVFVMPAHNPPHKPYRVLAPDTDRLEACRLAFSCLPEVEISDYEIAQGGTSYTYLTCRHFRSLYPDAEIFFLVGTDMLRDFPTWKNPQEILNDVTLEQVNDLAAALFRKERICKCRLLPYEYRKEHTS